MQDLKDRLLDRCGLIQSERDKKASKLEEVQANLNSQETLCCVVCSILETSMGCTPPFKKKLGINLEGLAYDTFPFCFLANLGRLDPTKTLVDVSGGTWGRLRA